LPLTTQWPRGVKLSDAPPLGTEHILTTEALDFIADLARRYTHRIKQLLQTRKQRQSHFDRGHWPDFLNETRDIREADWSVAPLPIDLEDRRVEITGPVDRKMVINALNSGANTFMADFEDATSPTWKNLVHGQANLKDAVDGAICYVHPVTGRRYMLGNKPATLLVRPRGWHLWEHHFEVDGVPIPAALFDFGLFFFHNVLTLMAKGTGPYFYLPKIESHHEARLWNDVFLDAQDMLDIPRGTIRATVLIETLPAAFEMDEILYELREHCAGLNCGRWDYIFSFIKTTRNCPEHLLPDRDQVTMDQPFMRAYTQLAIRTCHRRGALAMGGMAAQVPIKDDPQGNRLAIEKVRSDKLREVRDGHDGTWVAHPGLVPIAKQVFDMHLRGANQIDVLRQDVKVTANDLLDVPLGLRSMDGFRHNIDVAIRYLASWLGGIGCVPLYNLMEDAATAEISRAQVWQWIRHSVTLDDGCRVTENLFRQVLAQQVQKIRQSNSIKTPFENHCLDEATKLLQWLCLSEELAEFLTLQAYDNLLELE